MSHLIHVWETPLPDGLDAADDVLRRLAQRPAPPNPKFHRLMEAVCRRLAAGASTGASHDGPDDPPWVYGAPDGRSDTLAYSVQVLPSAAARVYALMADEARALGLVVYDEQLACLALPDGRRYGATPPAPPAAGAAPLASKAQVHRVLYARLHELLEPQGWSVRRQDAACARDGAEVRWELGFGCVARPPVFELALAATVVPRLPEPWRALAETWGASCHVLVDELLASAGFAWPGEAVQAHVRYTRLADEAALQAWSYACARAVGHMLLPFLHDCGTLAGLERHVNAAEGEPARFVPTYIGPILAHAVGSPRAEAVLAARLESRREPWIRDKYRALAADIARLRAGPAG